MALDVKNKKYMLKTVVIFILYFNADLLCNETGDVRLTHFDMDTKGRLEVCSDGYWGSVCRERDNAIAAVVCRQLGYFSAGQWIATHKNTLVFLVTFIPSFIQAGCSVCMSIKYLIYLLY